MPHIIIAIHACIIIFITFQYLCLERKIKLHKLLVTPVLDHIFSHWFEKLE